MLHNDKDLNLI